MENRSLVSIAQYSREKILYMLDMAKEFEKKLTIEPEFGKIHKAKDAKIAPPKR